MKSPFFNFKQFSILQDDEVFKIGTDGVLLACWADVSNASKALDVGIGTGLISLIIAQRNPELHVLGLDINPNAIQLAKKNVASSPWPDRVEVKWADVASFRHFTEEKFDLIISNPPFFNAGTQAANENRNLARHTAALSHRDLLRSSSKIINENGRICLILPVLEAQDLMDYAPEIELLATKVLNVRPKPEKEIERICMQFEWNSRTNKDRISKTELIIEEPGGLPHGQRCYSNDYVELCKDFYTIM